MYNVKDDYNEYDIVTHKQMASWKFPAWTGYQYDSISDELINEALNHPDIKHIDINIDWEDDKFLQDHNMREEMKHPMRIAKLVIHFRNSGAVYPVSIDTYARNYCKSCVSNGHHRIRALQFMGYDSFPAYCAGVVDVIEELLQ